MFYRDIPDQGDFWVANYRPGSDPQTFVDAANNLEKGTLTYLRKGCHDFSLKLAKEYTVCQLLSLF